MGRTPRGRWLPALLCAGALAGAGVSPGAAAAAAPEAFVRVNQGGYPTGAAKRAYVIASFDAQGTAWSILARDGSVVATGTLGAPVGSWSHAYPDVHTIDFAAVVAPGTYSIEIGGPAPARSPAFAVAAPGALAAAPLANALSFYENERDGPEFIPSSLRGAPAHLNDRQAATYATPKVSAGGAFKGELHPLGTTIDASGGWWDAGDYLKFVETTSYTVDLMLVGLRDFPALLGPQGPADFSAEARFGLAWLARMWDDRTGTLYYQVGIGAGNSRIAGDHDIWRLPQADDTYAGSDPRYRYIRNRPVFRAGPPGSAVSPNLAGRLAAAFGLCWQDFHSQDPLLAAGCLRAGEHVLDLANTHPRGHLLTALPFNFYPEREWRDDLELGAAELARALAEGGSGVAGLAHDQPIYYLSSAARWAREYLHHAKRNADSLNLYDVSGLADFELARDLRDAGEPAGLAIGAGELAGALEGQLTNAAGVAAADPFGFGVPWASADSASHGDGLAVTAAEYGWLTGDERFRALGERWLGNVLGANPWGFSMIVGDGSVFPHCPQHQVANLTGSLDGSPPVLAGAVVEGPSDEPSAGEVEGMRPCSDGGASRRFDNSAVFSDNVQSYTTVEPAIDLTASSILAFAWETEAPAG